jgi:AcrR family transcriptional regulator
LERVKKGRAVDFNVTLDDMNSRGYVMGMRAETAAATGNRILDAFITLILDRPLDEVSLDEVAAGAGVSTRTVIRRFGGKRGLFRAALEDRTGAVAAERAAPVGDVAGAIAVLDEHYAKYGELMLGLLAEERRRPEIAEVVAAGRQVHVAWCERTFAPALAGLRGVARKQRLAQIAAVCDLYTWKVLRHDHGLTSPQTRAALVGLLRPLVGGN